MKPAGLVQGKQAPGLTVGSREAGFNYFHTNVFAVTHMVKCRGATKNNA